MHSLITKYGVTHLQGRTKGPFVQVRNNKYSVSTFARAAWKANGAHSPGQAKRHPGFPVLVQSRPERAKALNVRLGASPDSNNFVTQISFQWREKAISVPHFPRIINTEVTFLNILTYFYPPRLEYSLYGRIFATWTRDVFKFCYLIFNNLTSQHVTHSSDWLKITLT